MMSATWHCTARLVYGVSHGLVLRFGGGMGSRPRRTHSRRRRGRCRTGSGEVARKLYGLSGRRRITPLSTDLLLALGLALLWP